MACRECGFIMLASSSVQEAADFALIAHLSTLKTRIPVLHFFDGFRTSHEFSKIELPDYEEILPYIDRADVERVRARATGYGTKSRYLFPKPRSGERFLFRRAYAHTIGYG